MAGIIKRGNRWWCIIHDATGKEIRKSTGIEVIPKKPTPGQSRKNLIAKSKSEAYLIANALEKELLTGSGDTDILAAKLGVKLPKSTSNRVPFDTLGREFLESINGKILRTKHYELVVRGFSEFLGKYSQAKEDCRKISKDMVEEWFVGELSRVAAHGCNYVATCGRPRGLVPGYCRPLVRRYRKRVLL